MFTWFRQPARLDHTAAELYGAVVAQARNPAFYAEGGIPDTAEGRYELIVLNLFLVLERLKRTGQGAEDLSRSLLETFVTDMDDNLREMGVGDLSVAKKVKRAAGGVYQRGALYRRALTQGQGAAARAIAEEVAGAARLDLAAAGRLLGYARAADAHLARLSDEACLAGKISFPSPASPA
jgi:cytochrome b pre-mRNA-processing protein 3